jgi:hypothetical protein
MHHRPANGAGAPLAGYLAPGRVSIRDVRHPEVVKRSTSLLASCFLRQMVKFHGVYQDFGTYQTSIPLNAQIFHYVATSDIILPHVPGIPTSFDACTLYKEFEYRTVKVASKKSPRLRPTLQRPLKHELNDDKLPRLAFRWRPRLTSWERKCVGPGDFGYLYARACRVDATILLLVRASEPNVYQISLSIVYVNACSQALCVGCSLCRHNASFVIL